MTEPRCFYRNDAEFVELREKLKLAACPHCKVIGNLIRHGTVHRPDADTENSVPLGQRIFCSNRGRKNGCGRTFTVWFAEKIHRSVLRARTLWDFLRWVVIAGITSAIAAVKTRLSGRTLHRFWRRFRDAQTHIRTALRGRSPPPEGGYSDTRHPDVAQLLKHLEVTFPNTESPIAEYQLATDSFFL